MVNSDYLKNLNEAQKEAVLSLEGPLLIVAGAGSGKTKVLTSRIAHIIKNKKAFPNQILAVTFTNKAAREMKLRISSMIGESESKNIWMGTFHSVFAKILRFEAHKIGFTSDFTIYDTQDSERLISSIIKEKALDKDVYRPKSIRNRISSLKNNFITVNGYFANNELVESDNLSRKPETGNIYKEYSERLIKSNSMDFDDLLENWLELLLKYGEGLPLKKQLQYILVDEYQDTNHIQAGILEELAKPHQNLMVVGDDAQSIYSWRGADFRNILEFPEKNKAQVYHLEQNYRSSPEILNAANLSINHNTRQFEKNLFSELPPGEKPVVHQLWDSSDEAEVVLNQLLALRDEGLSLDEMSVLYRNHVQAAVLQGVLTQAGIPFMVHSGVKFFEQAHIKDLTAFLKVLYNPLDEIAWMRLLRMLPGIGNTTANRIFMVFREQQAVRLTQENETLQKLIPAKSREEWQTMTGCLRNLLRDDLTPSEMIGIVYRDFYREVMYSEFENAVMRENDVQYLQEFSANYRSLEGFLNELSLVGSSIITDQEADDQDQETLTLTTIHQAKGLEWNAVFVIGLTEGQFPHQRSLDTMEQLEEERRLFYVAMTRAKRYLVICAPAMSSGYGGGMNGRSRFIAELPEDSIQTEVHVRDEYSYSSGKSTRFYF